MASSGYSSNKKRLKDKKITIYLEQNVGRPGGMPVSAYKPIHPGKLWAYVRQLSTKEIEPASGDWTQDTTLFEINWRSDVITLEHYVEYKGVFYEIVRVDTYEGYKDVIKLYGTQRLTRLKDDEFLPYEP